MGTQYAKAPIEPFAWARNGRYPDAGLAAELADHTNQLARYRLKELASFGSTAVFAPDEADTRTRWRFPFMLSPHASVIVCRVWMSLAETEAAASPGMRLRIQSGLESGGTPATIGDAELRWGGVYLGAAPPDSPDNTSDSFLFVVDSSGALPSIPANTWLFGTVSDLDRGRCNAITVFEGTLLDAPLEDGAAVGTPIYDKDREDTIELARLIWKRGAGRLFTWSVNQDSSARTRSSATPVNIIDATTTTASSTSLGFFPNAQYRSTLRRGTVPCRFWAYGSSAGTGGKVELRDSSNAVLATISGMTTAAWYSTTVNIPATDAKYDVFFAGDGTNTFSLYAAALLQHDTGA